MNTNVKKVTTVCGGCVSACSINVTVKDGRIDKISGAPDDPRTKGTICSKALAGKQVVEDPNRLKYPVRRVGERGENKWERISWDEALEEIADNFNRVKKETGPRAVSFFKGQASGWDFAFQMYLRLAHSFGTEPSMGTSECFAPRLIGHAMTYGGIPLYPDYENSNMIVCWGRQPAFSGATLMHSIFDAKERGAKLVFVDPLKFYMGAKADKFLRIEPGTDLALALAVLYVIVEKDLWDHDFVNKYTNDPGLVKLQEHLYGGNKDKIKYTPEWAEKITSIPANEIREFAEELAKTKGVSILSGHGLEGKVNVTQTARAISIIRVVTGNIDAPGGDLFTTMSPKLNPKFVLNHLVNPNEESPPFFELMSTPQYNPPGCTFPLLWAMQPNMPTPDILRQINDGEVKAGIFLGSDPIGMLPNTEEVKSTYGKLDFVAVVDPYISKTAIELADIVLPAATYLERTEPQYFKYDRWYPYIRLRKKIVEFAEARPDWEIIVTLGQKLGFEEYFPTRDIEYYTDLLLEPSGITFKQLEENKWIQHDDIEYKKYEKSGFAVPGGKANIFSEVFDQMGYDPMPTYTESSENPRTNPELAKEYPMICFTGRPGPMYVHGQGRTIPWIREMLPEARALINPKKAADLGIIEDDWIEVESKRGKISIKAKITNAIAPNSIYLPGGWTNSNYNKLAIDEDMCPISGQPNYTSCLAKVSKTEKGV